MARSPPPRCWRGPPAMRRRSGERRRAVDRPFGGHRGGQRPGAARADDQAAGGKLRRRLAGGRRPASRRCRRGRSKPSTARWRSGCAAGSSARPAKASAMSSSSIRLATATGAPATTRSRCRLWSSPISRWCARRARPARPTPNGAAGTAIRNGRCALPTLTAPYLLSQPFHSQLA